MEELYEKELEKLIVQIKGYNPNHNVDSLVKAYRFSYEAHENQLRKSGEPYFVHCLETAKILVDLRLDTATVVSGLLHDVVEDTGITLREVEQNFGKEVASLVDGVTIIRGFRPISKEEKQAENYRKMLLSVVKDIRVILIKLADRLHNMRTLEYLTKKKQQEIALETRDVYAPLAHRLGIARIKWELEDLTLKFLEEEVYQDLERKVAEKREQRELYIQKFETPIHEELIKNGVKARIEGRPKSLYSIYNKSKIRNVPFDKMYDLFAIRIIVKTIEECYLSLGLVHKIYRPFPDKFCDYIATPRANGYQSLHTAVFGPEGKIVEIQIRTEQMHVVAEQGIAAHWKYKEGKNQDSELDRHYRWLRQMVESIQEAKDDPNEVLERIKIDLFTDEVFVFTPNGKLLKLPIGSTPVDFAFAVHTNIGLHCLGAKVDGRIVPLNYKLKSGDSVEIITSAIQKPHIDWINFVRTSRAYSKIKRWFKESMFEQSQKLGEEILLKQFKPLNIKKDEIDLKAIAQSLGFSEEPELYSAIGRGDISAQQVVNRIVPEKRDAQKKDESFIKKFLHRARGAAKGVRVQGIDNLLIHFGKCCQPVPGDRILGFVTHGQGVVIHRNDCKNILKLMENPERNIEVEWDVEPDKKFMVRLHMLGEDRKHFLRDISDSISQTDTNIVSVEMRTQDSLVHSNIIIEVENLQHLTRIINKISKVTGVINVERLDGAGEPVVEH